MYATHDRTAIICLALLFAPSPVDAGPAYGLADVTPVFGSNTVYAEFDLKSLPATVNLCNSSIFLDNSGYDLIWVAGVNYNAGLSAYETLITAHTPLQQGCSIASPANLATTMQATLFHLDPQNFTNGYTLVSTLPVTVDIGAGKIVVQADRTDPVFSGLSDSTQAAYFTIEAVKSAPNGDFSPLAIAAGIGSTYPRDDAASFNFGGSFTDPADDVCTANQNCVSSAHPQVDLIGGSLYPQPVEPPPVFGSNTMNIEFDLSSLPSTVNLCNSGTFLENSGYDLLWVAGIGYNAGLSAYETLITAHTPLQQGCSTPSPASLATVMQATLFHLDPQNLGNGYTLVSTLPVDVDAAGGKIVVNADRSDPVFSSLSSSTLSAYFTVEAVMSSASGDFSPLAIAAALGSTYPRDEAPQFSFGGSFTDPTDDVCTAGPSCTSSSHPQIDLVAGSAQMDDYVFRDGFE